MGCNCGRAGTTEDEYQKALEDYNKQLEEYNREYEKATGSPAPRYENMRTPEPEVKPEKESFNIYHVVKDELTGNATYVDTDEQIRRVTICDTCPRLFTLTRNCKECGCFVDLKTKYEKSTCPLGKW